MEDREIISLYFDRNEAAISETDKKYGSYCRSIAVNILKSDEDSEECVSDTWLMAWNTIPPKKPTYLKSYLAKITRNFSINRYRSSHTEKRGGNSTEAVFEELKECIASPADIHEQLEAKNLAESINRFLDSLPKRTRKLFVRRYFFMETNRDIAKRFGIKEGTVGALLARTREKLREHLRREGFDI